MNRAELNAMGEFRDSLGKLIETIKKKEEEMRVLFRGMSREELIEEFRLWDDEQVSTVCERLALETEDYEICAAAKVVKDERGLQ